MKKFLLFLSLLACTNAMAALYKWVDADGQIHYSDQPPSAQVKKLLPAPPITTAAPVSEAPAASAPAATKTAAEREAEQKLQEQLKQEAADKAAQEQKIAEANKANCDAARQNLRVLQSGARIMEVDAKGQRYYLDDKQRQQRTEKARSDIATYCK